MYDFTDKNVIITGSASGIGRFAAELFAEQGATIIGIDVDEDGLAEAHSSLEGDDHVSFHADVSEKDDVIRMADKVGEDFEKIHVLFNNAGISHPSEPIEELSEEVWDEVHDANLKSAFLCSKYLLSYLRNAENSSIVNNASIAAVHPRPGTSAYASSNGGMVSLTRQLAVELLEAGIRVNGINATATDTPLLTNLQNEREGSGYVSEERIVSSIPLGRLVQPEEVAHAALYLASDQAAMVTGTLLPMEGGRTI